MASFAAQTMRDIIEEIHYLENLDNNSIRRIPNTYNQNTAK